MFSVILLWVFFRAPNLNYAFSYIAAMFGANSVKQGMVYVINLWQWVILIIGILLSGPAQLALGKVYAKVKEKNLVLLG